ncbi:hypothetical protein [Rummeliibacillus stabekisii]|uniref:Uncharacterized protein n=1 Tax=Rummeliibacillus stabekisii TaxID=241244 RepID=A0A143HD18_9BACL|nr:hypothetical protein [Rummeliibacillus stabekisii]AMW99370.1 hypothetical protein ATY39_07760 [Rummeliibacillus stabekisii]
MATIRPLIMPRTFAYWKSIRLISPISKISGMDNSFAYHFCIPTFMLDSLKLADSLQAAVLQVQDTFNVLHEFALKRLNEYLTNHHNYSFVDSLTDRRKYMGNVIF